jgi:flagellar L-ring protein precursor FlgH
VAATAAVAWGGEKSSLLKSGKTTPPPVVNEKGEEIYATAQPTVATVSIIAVEKPKPRDFQLHDVITIIVREESSSKSEADASTEKDFKVSADLKEWIKLHDKGTTLRIVPDEGIAALNPKVDVSMKRSYEGEGDASTKDSFLTKIAAEVIDIKPNGNLVLEAKRYIQSNDEKITMTLTGTVSPKDVGVTNTVNSSSVTNLSVVKKTEGIARSGQKRGWLVRLLDLINPF